MTQGRRLVGDVYIAGTSVTNPVYVFDANDRAFTIASADVTTSGGGQVLSVNTSGAYTFAITNFGSINVYVEGSFNGIFFVPSVGVTRAAQAGGAAALTSAVECVSASTIATFNGPYAAIRVMANSGSGVYRAALTYR